MRSSKRHLKRRVWGPVTAPLERRVMFAVVAAAGGVPDVNVVSGAYPTTVELNSVYSSTTIPGRVVEVALTYGDSAGVLDIGLYDNVVKATADNFVGYAQSGLYDGTFFDRSVSGSYLQGGGYDFGAGGTPIKAGAGIASQFPQSPRNVSGEVNVAGTVAAYHAASSLATSQFVINVGDNAPAFDAAQYTVFGRVLGNGMDLVGRLNALPTVALGPPFDQLPVANYSAGSALTVNNVVLVSSAKVVSAINYSVTSTATDLVTADVNQTTGMLSLSYVNGATGSAVITISAVDLDGATLTQSFNVNVAGGGNLAATFASQRLNPAGGVTTNFGNAPAGTLLTQQFIVQNTGSETLTDVMYGVMGVAGQYSLQNVPPMTLTPGQSTPVSVLVSTAVTGPSSGVLTISSGSAGTAVITIPIAANVQRMVTIGGGGAAPLKSLVYTQSAGGTAATFTLANPGIGTATFALSGAGLTTNVKSGVVTVSGSATLDSLVISGTAAKAKLTITGKGSAPVVLNTVTGTGGAALASFTAKTGQEVGPFVWGGGGTGGALGSVILGSIVGGNVNISQGEAAQTSSLSATTISNSTLAFGGSVKALVATALTGGTVAVTGNLVALTVKSGVATPVTVSGSLGTARIGGMLIGGNWNVGGSVGKLTAAGGAAAFSLKAGTDVASAVFAGDFSGAISGRTVGSFAAASGTGTTLIATGITDASNVTTGGTIKSVVFKGNVSAAYVSAGNSIGSFAANSIAQTRIYGGAMVDTTALLPAAVTQFSPGSSIGSIKLTGKKVAAAFNVNAVAARSIGTLALGVIQPISDTPNGVAAVGIGSISGSINRQKFSKKLITSPADAATIGALGGVAGTNSSFGVTILT